MKKVISYLVLLLSLIILGEYSYAKNDNNPFGVHASSSYLDSLPDSQSSLPNQPPQSKTEKSYITLNKYGYDVIDISKGVENSWLIKELLDEVKSSRDPILDVGGGYGGLTFLMSKLGATVIYNDIDEGHLYYGKKQLSPSQKERVYLNSSSFPEEMNFPKNSLEGVVLHRVLHFLTPSQIEKGIEKISNWLKPGGKVYIVVLTPQHAEYRSKVLQKYDDEWQQGNPWPGYSYGSKDILPDQAENLPEQLHVMDGRPLKRILEKNGFVIIKDDFIGMKQYGKTELRDGKEAYGLIAMKNVY